MPEEKGGSDNVRRFIPGIVKASREAKMAKLKSVLFERGVNFALDDANWPIVELRVAEGQEEKARKALHDASVILEDEHIEPRQIKGAGQETPQYSYTIRIREA